MENIERNDFNGDCEPFETRTEVINVKGGSSVNLTVRRTIHGPVVFTPPAMSGVVFTQKRVVWKREIESAKRFLAINRARYLDEFEAAVRKLDISHHFLYGDRVGNIAYWMSGTVPVRPSGLTLACRSLARVKPSGPESTAQSRFR